MLLDNHANNEIGVLGTLLPGQQDLGSPRRLRGQQGQCRVKDQCKSQQGCIKQREGDNPWRFSYKQNKHSPFFVRKKSSLYFLFGIIFCKVHTANFLVAGVSYSHVMESVSKELVQIVNG